VCAACQTLCIFQKSSKPAHPGHNIHDTFSTGTWPDTSPSKLGGTRCVGKPKLRWLDSVEGYFRKTGVRKWRRK
jgi:hypothetical protein